MTIRVGEYLRPGDTVMVGQAAAEPKELVRQFLRASRHIEALTAICGYTLSKEWDDISPEHLLIRSYVGHGAFRSMKSQDIVEVIPWHYSRFEGFARGGLLRADVVLLQVGPLGDDGYYDLGPTVDYVSVVAEHARVVLVEVNEKIPRTRSSRRLHHSFVTAAVPSADDLPRSPSRQANESESRVAEHVAALIPSGATLQLGVGALADAIVQRLLGHRDLRIRSGLAGDWLIDLHEAGALDSTADACQVGIAVGSQRLYDFVSSDGPVSFVSMTELLSPTALGESNPFISVNSAIEVDLMGQANSEVADNRYVGAVGGQVDFFRAAQSAQTGLAILALSSRSPAGATRIVDRLSGPVSTLKSDVDIVATEWGIADLRTASFSERRVLLSSIADPRHRDALLSSSGGWERAWRSGENWKGIPKHD